MLNNTAPIKKKTTSTRLLVIIALMGAMAFVIELFRVKLPIFPPWLSLDVADVPAILTSMYLGPLSGFAVEGIKILLKLFFSGTITGGIGELSNFIMGCALCLPAGLVYKKTNSEKMLVAGLFMSVLLFCAVGVASNHLFILPIYSKVMGEEALINMAQSINPSWDNLSTIVIAGVTPFNALKSVLACGITFSIHKLLPEKFKEEIKRKNDK